MIRTVIIFCQSYMTKMKEKIVKEIDRRRNKKTWVIMMGHSKTTYLYNVVTLRYTLSSKLDTDTVVSWVGWCKQDVKCTVLVLNNINVNLCSCWTTDSACDFTRASLRGINSDNCLFVNWDCLWTTI